jgi:beta-glucosidase
MSFEFPEGFWWGTATAAHQVEGNNVYNDNWLMEHTAQTIYTEPSGDACDHYHHYADDIALLANLGFNSYRFSVEWSRIEPEENYFSRAEIEHYRRMLAACHENHLRPVVTFHHFTSPRWVAGDGGWEDERTVSRFARYCERVTRDLGDLIQGGCTINEPNIGALIKNLSHGEMTNLNQMPMFQNAARSLGVPVEKFRPYFFASSDQGRDVMLAAHHKAVEAIKSTGATFPVGMTLALQDIQPADDREETARRVQELDALINDVFLESLRGDDFVGVQTYSRMLVDANGPVDVPQGAEVTQMGYEFYPEALEHTIRRAARIAGAPVLVTENGIATSDDTRRVEYIRRALNGVANCLTDGVPMLGYFYWSMMDNFEWMQGYRMTFGLVGVDRETQERTVKPSARYLGSIARANRTTQ